MKNKTGAQIIDIVSFMPERIVRKKVALNIDHLDNNLWFKPPEERRFAHPEYSSADLGYLALKKLLEKTRLKAPELDLIIYSCVFSDNITAGIGPVIQHRSGASNATVMSVDTGCASYLTMLNTARAFIEAGIHKTCAVITVTNFVSRLSDFQASPKAAVLGDGASATLIRAGKTSILSHYEKSHGENYGILACRPQLNALKKLDFWEPNAGPLAVEFSLKMVEKLRSNATLLVPYAVNMALEKAQLNKSDVSLLVTHQPNIALIESWRESIGIHGSRTHDTFNSYGNVFHGSIPVTLSDALEKKKLQINDTVALGTFSNGGDFVGGMVLKWHGAK